MPLERLQRTLRHLQSHLYLGLAHRLSPRRVPLDRVLVGQQSGFPARDWYLRTGDPTRLSRLLSTSPYVTFLRQCARSPELLDSPEALQETEYYRMARLCLEQTGNYFEARQEPEILEQMRRFHRLSREYASDRPDAPAPRDGHSPPGRHPVLRRVRDSDCLEVVDGHHRLAIQAFRGEAETLAVVLGSTRTLLQERLLRVNQVHGVELYQPVPLPEVAGWHVVRRCQDRFEKMQAFLEERDLLREGDRVLDCGCSYGWFLARFQELGLEAEGLDRDPRVARIGAMVYGLDPGQFHTRPLEDFLGQEGPPYDVVLFLSLLHHYGLGKEPGAPGEILRKVAARTRKVLFLDAGQATEAWFRHALPDWDPSFLEGLLREEGGFREVVPLGTDEDARGPYTEQYGRTLFACVK